MANKELSESGADHSNRGQFIAGSLSVAFAYAAGFATDFAGYVPNAVQTLVHDANVLQLPLHALFILASASVGAAGMAGWQRWRREKAAPSQMSNPSP